MMMRKAVTLVCCLLICCLAGGAMADTAWDTAQSVYEEGSIVVSDAEREAGLPIFEITMEDGRVIRGELYPEVAPQAVGNFVALANSGYYDGKIFHRVVPGFVIQGGSPNGDGIGGAGWNIKGEFGQNGVTNEIKHVEGVLSMARTNAGFDTAGSQFFIMTGTATSLDGAYAAFGLVTDGMDVVYEIVSMPRNASDKPNEDQVIAQVRVETFGVEYPFDKL